MVGAGAAIQALHGALILQAFGSYAVVLERQFGWSKTTFATAFSFNRAESGLLGPIQGWALVRFGSKAVMRVGIVVLATGFVLFSQVDEAWQFIGAFFVMSVGAGLSGFLTINTAAVRWFELRRARALSVMATGLALGGLLVPLVVWLLEEFGWRRVAAFSAIPILAICWPISSWFSGGPADRGDTVDGLPPRAAFTVTSVRTNGLSDVHFTAREALRTRAFWMISLGHACALLIVGSVIAHLSLYLTSEHDFDLQRASFVMAAIPIFQIIGILLAGAIGDRCEKRLLASIAMLGHMVGLLTLTFATADSMVWMFVVLHGLAWGARGPLMQAMRADYFGSTAFGQIMGLSSIVLMLGIVGGPLLAGVLADVTGNYRVGFIILSALSGIGTVFFVLATPPPLPDRDVAGFAPTRLSARRRPADRG